MPEKNTTPNGDENQDVDALQPSQTSEKTWSSTANSVSGWLKRTGRDLADRAKRTVGATAKATSDTSDQIAETAKRAATAAAELVSDAAEDAAAGASYVVDRAGAEYARRLGEDEAQIIRDCPLITQLLDQREAYESDPGTIGLLQNVRLKPILGAAVLTGVGVGAAMQDEVLSRATRTIFDGKAYAGGWLQDSVAGIVGADTVGSVNRFMDTVPGSDVMGGGWIHRIQHGHDLSAVAEVWGEHGPAGGIQALYHIYGRDFFTPAGIPILPTGSEAVHRQFVEMGMKPAQAADWLSINFVELLGCGVGVLGVIRLIKACKAAREDAAVKALTQKAMSALERDDFLTARDAINDAVVERPADGELAFLRGMIHQRCGEIHEAHDSYRLAMKLMVKEDPGLSIGGAAVSFRGIAGLGALSTISVIARVKEYEAVWLDRVTDLARATCDAFEQMAGQLTDRRYTRNWGEQPLLPPRYLSAAMNYRLAGQVVGQSLVLPDRENRLLRIGARLEDCWIAIEENRDLADSRASIEYLRQLTGSELAALPSGPSGQMAAAASPSDPEA